MHAAQKSAGGALGENFPRRLAGKEAKAQRVDTE